MNKQDTQKKMEKKQYVAPQLQKHAPLRDITMWVSGDAMKKEELPAGGA